MKPKRRIWLRAAGFVVGLYGFLTLSSCMVLDGMLFHPEYSSRAAPPGAFFLQVADGTSLSAVYLPNRDAKFTLWYFYGNAEDLVVVIGDAAA